MHWCCNAVCGGEGEGWAVLIRALEPLEGIELMRTRRGAAARRDRDLCSGPAKLTEALAITGIDNGLDLVGARDRVTITAGDSQPNADVVQTTRIGLSKGRDHPWRWYLRHDPNVSRR
jgi:DNA-3-methyladenine glycosylase